MRIGEKNMRIIVALIPAFLWGFLPIVVNKFGGKPIQQQLGTAFGCGIAGVLVYIIARPEVTTEVFIGCLISGVEWSLGQLCEYKGYVIVGTSKAFALSISLQMLLNSFCGAFLFNEWTTSRQLLLGFSAIILVIIGGNVTAYTKDKADFSALKKGLLTLGLGSIGYVVWNYSIAFVKAEGIAAVFPQAIGMVLGSLLLSLFEPKDIKKFAPITFKLIVPGFLYAGANIGLIFSNKLNGVAVGYTMAQLCLVVEIILGFLLLHEHKNKKEMAQTVIGAAFIVAGCIMVGMV